MSSKKNIAIIIDNDNQIFLKGERIIEYSVQVFYETKFFDEIIIADKDEVFEIARKYHNYNNYNIIIHNSDYPFITCEDISNILESLNQNINPKTDFVLASKVTNTIKVCDENNIVKSTIDRNLLWSIKPTYSCNLIDTLENLNSFENMHIIETNSFNILVNSPETMEIAENIL